MESKLDAISEADAGGSAVTPGQVDDTDHTNVPEQTDGALAKLRLKTGRSTATTKGKK